MDQGNPERKWVFRPRARLLVLLGEQMIKNEVTAVTELVRNSYDADATLVQIEILGAKDCCDGTITVTDDGIGMSLETVEEAWLEPATEYRRKIMEEKRTRRTDKGRMVLGEKGIGRFAVHKLGRIVELVTKPENSEMEVVVRLDWREFEKDQYLDTIEVPHVSRRPEVFVESHGTRITVSDLHRNWTDDMVKALYTALQGLTSPFEKVTDFEVRLTAPEFVQAVKAIPRVSDVVENAPYRFRGEVGADGIMSYRFEFTSRQYPSLNESISGSEDLGGTAAGHVRAGGIRQTAISDWLSLQCGPFSVGFNAWDLDRWSMSDIPGGHKYYLDAVKPHTGIRIYRDSFRVWPYGEKDDDWLSMDQRRVNDPTNRLSRNQVVGIVEITREKSPNLRDKTNREGLVENVAFVQFYNLVIQALGVFEKKRRKKKEQVDRLRTRGRPADLVVRKMESLGRKVKRYGHEELYAKDLSSLRRTYEKRIEEILEPYLVQASIGIAYTIPIHDMIVDLRNLRKGLIPVAEVVNASKDAEAMEALKSVASSADHMQSLLDGVRKLVENRESERLTLEDVARDALSIVQPRMKSEGIVCQIDAEQLHTIRGSRKLLMASVLNLLDNSIYWIRFRGKDKRIQIVVDDDAEGNPRIVVSDSGSGFQDPLEEAIQPFFSRKPDGIGLGLYIVDWVMKQHGGHIEMVKEKGLLEGASIALVFGERRDRTK